MIKNIGIIDRIIRLLIAAVLFFSISFFGNKIIQGTLLVLSVFCVFQSVAGWCPLYAMLGINTCKKQ